MTFKEDLFKRLEQLTEELKKLQETKYNLIKLQMDRFKGRYFKVEDEGKVVKISIFYTETSNYDNCMEYKRCYYCKDKHKFSWWQVDEQMSFDYKENDLEKLYNAREIGINEYHKLRNTIIKQVENHELDKVKKEFNKLKENP